jgi:predicted enzyme related to lactoylglutathione lyase
MIKEFGHVTLLVRDHDETLRFYTNILGMEKRRDMAIDGFRWLAVAPKGEKTEITFVKADSPEKLARVGSQAANHVFLVLHTDDCRKEAARLESRGMKILSQPSEQPYGIEAVFQDLYGNVFDLLQPRSI